MPCSDQFIFKLRASKEEWEVINKIIKTFGTESISRWVYYQTFLFCKKSLLPYCEEVQHIQEPKIEKKIIISARMVNEHVTNLQLLEMFSRQTGISITEIIRKFVIDPPMHKEYQQIMCSPTE